MRMQANKEHSDWAYQTSKEKYYESRHDNEPYIITLFILIACIPMTICCLPLGALLSYIFTVQTRRVNIVKWRYKICCKEVPKDVEEAYKDAEKLEKLQKKAREMKAKIKARKEKMKAKFAKKPKEGEEGYEAAKQEE